MSCIFFNQFILHKKDTSPPSSQKLIDLEENFEQGGELHRFSKVAVAGDGRPPSQIWNYLYDEELIDYWREKLGQTSFPHIEWGPTSSRRGTASDYTGPQDAHSGNYFLYTEASAFGAGGLGSGTAGYGAGTLYKLQSDKFKIDSGLTSRFTFYYHMFGKHISWDYKETGPGHLCVTILKDNGVGGGELSPECVFLKESEQQSSMESPWREGVVNLNNNIMMYTEEGKAKFFDVNGTNFLTWVGQSYIRIIISLKVGGSWQSDIAIDSLKLENIEHDGNSSEERWLPAGARLEKASSGGMFA